MTGADHAVVVSAMAIVAMLVLAVVLPVAGIELALHVAAARARRRRSAACAFDDPDDERRVGDEVAVFVAECALALWALVVSPLVWLRSAERADRRTRVVVVQGPGALAGAALPLLVRLRAAGRRPLLLRPPLRGVEATLGWLAVRLAAARHASGEPLDVIALGRGGLYVRALVARHGRRAGVVRLLTIGTPHGGTEAAPWPPLAWLLAPVRFGRTLVRTGIDAAALTGVRECIAVASDDDAVILPPDAAYWPGAFNIRVRGLGHLGLLASARVFELVRENLAADGVGPASTRARDAPA